MTQSGHCPPTLKIVCCAHLTKSHKLSVSHLHYQQLVQYKTIAFNHINFLAENFTIEKFLFLENFKIIHVVDKPRTALMNLDRRFYQKLDLFAAIICEMSA
jgi:hypothetical protein